MSKHWKAKDEGRRYECNQILLSKYVKTFTRILHIGKIVVDTVTVSFTTLPGRQNPLSEE